MAEKKVYDKQKQFSDWYVKAIEDAELLDQRYPVKGFPVYTPWGFTILRKLFRILEDILETQDEIKPTLFPVVIPEDFLKRESEHIAGFEGEVFWVTHGGETPLSVRLALRPTSETAMYPMFSYWIRSYADLPLKIHQTVTVYRYETKHTRMLIRGREVFWNEGHTAHETWEDAYKQVLKTRDMYASFFDRFGLPYVILKRPEWDKFPGADFTVAFDTLMPDGRVLQIGTVHHLGEHFAKAFEIIYMGRDQEQHYVSQTSFGISMRVLAAIIGVHGDNIGIILPPEIAPIQIVIVPIPFDEKENTKLLEYCNELRELLTGEGYKVHLDDSEDRPGEKYYRWERKGVPLRLEIGRRELANRTVTLVRRDAKKKITVSVDDLISSVKDTFEIMTKELHEKAIETQNKRIYEVDSLDQVKRIINKKGGLVKAPICDIEGDSIKCAEEIKSVCGGEVRGITFPEPEKPKDGAKCIVCGRPAKYVAWIARAY